MNLANKHISIGKKLPHGAKKQIAISTGLCYKTVKDFFKNGIASKETTSKILEASKPFVEIVQQNNEAQESIIKMGTFLPYGAKIEIAKSTGISQQTINSFFKTGIAGAEVTAKIKEASKPFLELQKELLAKQLDNIALGASLPHGAKKKVSEITGISQQTINSFFRTGKAGADVTAKIIEASKPFAEQFERVRKEMIELTNLFTK